MLSRCIHKEGIFIFCACSSVDRASGCGPEGRRFDSCQAHQNRTQRLFQSQKVGRAPCAWWLETESYAPRKPRHRLASLVCPAEKFSLHFFLSPPLKFFSIKEKKTSLLVSVLTNRRRGFDARTARHSPLEPPCRAVLAGTGGFF